MTSSLAFASSAADASSERARNGRFECRVFDPLHGSDWDAALNEYNDATTFHTAAWARVLAKSYGHEPLYLSFSQGAEVIGLLPLMEVRSAFTGRRAVSLPFSDFCGPLISKDDATKLVSEKIGDLISERCWDYVELRGGPVASGGLDHEISFYGHKLSSLGSKDELWDRLASPVRRAIRKAEKSDVAVEVSTTREALREFYQLHRRTRRRHGLPPQPFRFFQNIYDEIIGREGGFVVLAKRASRSIAAAVFFEFNGNAVFKFGASDQSQQVVRANNLVMWEAIKRLADRGCRTLHFGRTELGNEGLRRFKQGWGAIEEVIPYFRFYGLTRPRPAEKKPSAFHTALFRNMPLPINGLAGALIYPHLD